ncbi:hypothetical protein ACLB2K_072358 [Fragaria x ananassa]
MASKMVQIKSKNKTKKFQPIDAWTTMGENLMKQRCSTSSGNSRKHSPSPTTKVHSKILPHLELPLDNQIDAILEDNSCAMQVMVIGVINVEEQAAQIAQLTEVVKKLQKTIEEKDVEIASLMEKLEVHHENDWEDNLHGDKNVWWIIFQAKKGIKFHPSFIVSSTALRHDFQDNQRSIWWFVSRYTDVFQALHQAARQFENANWLPTSQVLTI